MPYALKFDSVSATVQYKGEAIPGADVADPIWRVCKINVTGDDIDIIWADGNTRFDNIWDNRASLSYS